MELMCLVKPFRQEEFQRLVNELGTRVAKQSCCLAIHGCNAPGSFHQDQGVGRNVQEQEQMLPAPLTRQRERRGRWDGV